MKTAVSFSSNKVASFSQALLWKGPVVEYQKLSPNLPRSRQLVTDNFLPSSAATASITSLSNSMSQAIVRLASSRPTRGRRSILAIPTAHSVPRGGLYLHETPPTGDQGEITRLTRIVWVRFEKKKSSDGLFLLCAL